MIYGLVYLMTLFNKNNKYTKIKNKKYTKIKNRHQSLLFKIKLHLRIDNCSRKKKNFRLLLECLNKISLNQFTKVKLTANKKNKNNLHKIQNRNKFNA